MKTLNALMESSSRKHQAFILFFNKANLFIKRVSNHKSCNNTVQHRYILQNYNMLV